MIKNFSIFKNHKKEKDTHPDYTISAKVTVNNVDEFKEIGAVYLKDSKNGEKYFSCSLAKTREYNGKVYPGYVIVDEVEFEKMNKVYTDYLIQQRNPGYPTPTEQNIDLDKMNEMLGSADKPFEITEEDFDKAIPF